VMMLAALMQWYPALPVANALKNLVMGTANAVAAVVFSLVAPVRWSVAGLLAAGFLAGGILGPRLVRRLNPRLLRTGIALGGLAVAFRLQLGS
jgi:uncharacterized protein